MHFNGEEEDGDVNEERRHLCRVVIDITILFITLWQARPHRAACLPARVGFGLAA